MSPGMTPRSSCVPARYPQKTGSLLLTHLQTGGAHCRLAPQSSEARGAPGGRAGKPSSGRWCSWASPRPRARWFPCDCAPEAESPPSVPWDWTEVGRSP